MRYAPFPLAVYAGKQARHPVARSPYMLMRCRTRGVETMYYIVSIGVHGIGRETMWYIVSTMLAALRSLHGIPPCLLLYHVA